MGREIIVVTSAYGSDTIRHLGGQENLLELIRSAGADGVEIRRELFNKSPLAEASAIGHKIAHQQLSAYYSVPAPLFITPGELHPQLAEFQQEAIRLGAKRIKFSAGAGAGTLSPQDLSRLLSAQPVPVLIENDQTEAGRLSSLNHLFRRYSGCQGLAGMTFDMGNWLWVGEDPKQAAAQLAPYIRYIHVKAAVPHNHSFRAVAIDNLASHWLTLLRQHLPEVPLAIEFPLQGEDLAAVTRHYVSLLRHALSTVVVA